MAILRFGTDSEVQLDFDSCDLLAECGVPEPRPPQTIEQLVDDALAEPIGIPGLGSCVTSSDQITIALEDGVPQGDAVAAAVVAHLAAAGVNPDGIAVLRSTADAATRAGNPLPHLPEDIQRRVRLIDHDPNDQKSLAFLATATSGEPVWLNRALTDADMVVPIGATHGRAVPGHFGLHGAVYPTFADAATQARFRSPKTLGPRGRHRRSFVKAVDEIGWLLGVVFAVQVVPGSGDSVRSVVGGEAAAVRRRARAIYRKTWRWDIPRRARLVIAGIQGGPAQQTWRNLARALAAATACVDDQGAVVVCCELAGEPGEAVACLRRAQTPQDALREIVESTPDDALAAAQLVYSLDRADVYLLSGLEPGLLEDLSIAPVESIDEVNRLASRFPDAVLLANAPHTIVRVEGE